ncbi:uncharacterized protein LOC123318407 [Coccinella septempunctata]|uniref:uncharacterized protein LOC123318407 n=1 Tax=Coccinella septempunctata TaxID=41139 RepID=UPI001D0878EA|nr:uncharacterized protein LOC123318407 [Coccinella septempunctata]
MDLDNPSYFNIAGDATRTATCGSVSSSSDCSLSRQLTPPRNRMGMRSFARSISSNSTESNQFIRGEPRLSDLAPDLAAKHISKQKTKTQNGIVYSSLALDPESDSGDEVFLEESSARYYNCSAGSRRQSVGSFSARDRAASVSSSLRSFREEAPCPSRVDEGDCAIDISGMMATSPVDVIDDHAIRHGSFPRKRCSKCVKADAPSLACCYRQEEGVRTLSWTGGRGLLNSISASLGPCPRRKLCDIPPKVNRVPLTDLVFESAIISL